MSLVKLAFGLLILVVFESVQICFDLLFKLVSCNFGLTVLALFLEHLSLFFDGLFLVDRVVLGLSSVGVILVHLLPQLDLTFIQKSVVVHQLEVLQEVGVPFLDAFVPVLHEPHQNLGLVVGDHQQFDVLSVDVAEFLVA